MAARLRRAFDPSKWGRGEQTAWRGLSSRGVDAGPRPPRIVVLGGARFEPDAAIQASAPLILHRSKPLKDVLRRFNCFSNNDIERIGSLLGSPADLRALLAATIGQGDPGVRVATTSGLAENRLTLRQIVALMREFRTTAGALGLDVEGLLPVSGCDPGTVTASFPRLALGESFGSVVGKTGTLTTTDGGIVALAGFANTTAGDIVFAVAAPRAGGRLLAARRAEESWLLDLIARHGGPRPRACAPPLAGPEAGAVILDGSASYASATPGAPAGDPRDGGHAR